MKTTNQKPTTSESSTQPRAHSECSPSKLQTAEACGQFENNPFSDPKFAEEGTVMHDATETGKLEGLEPEQVQQVEACIDYVCDLKSRREKEGWKLEAEEKEKFVVVEEVAPGWGGHVDLVLVWSKQGCFFCDVIDYKFGKHPVEDAENNLQGFSYFLGVLAERPAIAQGMVHFIAPRRDEISYALLDAARKDEFVTRIKAVRARALNPNTPATPRDQVCQYCAKLGSCEAVQKFALKVANKYEPLEINADVIHPSRIVKDPQVWRQVLKATTILDAWIKSTRKYALDLVLTQDFDIPGYEVFRTKGKRSLKDYKAAVSFLKDYGLTAEDIDSITTISLTDLEKKVEETAPKGKKTSRKAELNKQLDENGLLEYSEPSVYLKALK